MRLGFLIRWSLRDLRRRWVQVLAIAMIIAVGTGVYSGLGSTATWRRESNDASFAALGMYDLRVVAAPGADAPQGEMLSRLDTMADRGDVVDAEERLVLPTQVDASTPAQTVLVPGRVVGLDTAGGGPALTDVWVEDGDGRRFTADEQAVVLERNFASFYDLAPTGSIAVGARRLDYVGTGLGPEYFFITSEDGGFFAQANLAVVFAPLATAQELTGRAGRVNDLVLRLHPGADVAAVAGAVERAFEGSGLAVTVMERRDEDAYRVLYDDIDSDARFWNVFAGLILAGAAFGAFNMANRMVEAERRQIGIGMALGAPASRLALRPLFVGVEIAVAGAALGLLAGFGVVAALRPVFEDVLPLPIWRTELDLGTFARGAALGVVLPIVATAWPVWRAVRVTPVEAIATTHRTGRSGLALLLRRLARPAGAFARMPIGNVLRVPRRTALTALGIAAAVAALVATLGMIDSFLATMDRNEQEVLGDHPDRLTVTLQDTQFEDGDVVAGIADDPSVGELQPVLRVPGRLSARGDGEPADVVVDVTDLDGAVWAPSLVRGGLGPDRSGLVISREAASDLDIGPGDVVRLEHPAPGAGGVELVQSELRVAAVHPSPFRFVTYLDRSQLARFGAAGVVNQLYVVPAPGATVDDVQRSLFGAPGVASALPVEAASRVIEDSLDDFVGIFRVLQGFIAALALLIAYNAARINSDERAREHATLFAFGLPVRRVVWMEVVEHTLIGVLGTVLGVLGGLGVLRWTTEVLLADTMPEMGLDTAVRPATWLGIVLLGVVAVAVAPLLTLRRLTRMDVPDTLRLVE